ncbi:MAG: hypothetical protein ACK55X_02595 [Synechococcaceae cyanobacterium]
MSHRRGLLLLALQSTLLLSLSGRLLLDRALLPRGWARTAPVDPELPIRGRYVSLRLEVPLEGSRGEAAGATGRKRLENTRVRLRVRGGGVVGEPLAAGAQGQGPGVGATRIDGDLARLQTPLAFFLPEHVRDPSQRPAGEELWAEVSLPERGAPRPIRLGVRRAGQPGPVPLP